MNDMIDTNSDLRNQITVTFPEVMFEQPELSEEEVQSLEDTIFLDELTEYVATLPTLSTEEVEIYNNKVSLLETIRNEIECLKPKKVETVEEYYAIPAGRYDYVYRMGTI
jgi:hypothetical protein